MGCGFESHGGHVFYFTLISYVPGAMLPLIGRMAPDSLTEKQVS